ncbi:unnamed protein product [Parnassius apollo]|uniref:(apollo) hypothetical protein n=1 Tax=Parnassius apollo TaxID=110799 RepID=A0A8S3XCQ1_PARAO|nr:unnamed protein product [Parnassius apollo]
MSFPKIEMDLENEAPSYKRDCRYNWNSENTMKLIDTMEKECKELWDLKHPLNKDRVARQAKMEYLANVFGTSAEEISRKIHNLRTQFNNELRKIKRRSGNEGSVVAGSSGWEYFDALTFLLRAPTDPLDTVDSVNLALAEFQADEELEFGIAARAHLNNNTSNNSPTRRAKPAIRVAASAPPPLPPSAHPMMWPEEPLPRLRPGVNADECQIFGDFVASELRTLRSDESRKKLKRMIQKAILQVGEEEDVNIISG